MGGTAPATRATLTSRGIGVRGYLGCLPVFDLIIVGSILAAAGWGYRRGAETRALPFVGFGVGALVGSRVVPPVLGFVLPDPYAPMLAVPVLIGCAVLFAVGFNRMGLRLRERVYGRRRLDAAWGAGLAVLIGLCTVWLVAGAVARVDALEGLIGDSAIVAGLNGVLPSPGPLVSAEHSGTAEDGGASAADAGPGRVNLRRDPQVIAAKASVVKVGVLSCGSQSQGSGWVAGDGLVVTNAHVVAQSQVIWLQVEGTGRSYPAETIWYDDDNDIAILRSAGVRGERPLPIDPTAERGTRLAMLGFPDGGPYTVKPARLGVSSRIPGVRLEGGDFVTRRVARLIASVRPGNSGGPLVNPEGQVVGVVFAGGGYTAFAVPASAVQHALRRAEGPVSTGTCGEEG